MNLVPDADYQHRYRDYTFKGKRPDEEIVLLLRHHWLIFVFNYIPVFFFLLFIILVQAFGPSWIKAADVPVAMNVFYLAITFLWMFFWLTAFVIWVDYYLDVWIVTNQRVINIEQFGLFRREVSELGHSKVQDVTTKIKGFIPTLFKYGNVYIQTAGTKERFVFKQVPNPVFIRSVIMKLQKRAIQEQKKREGEILRGKL